MAASEQGSATGVTILERFVASVRQRVEKRLWHSLARGLSLQQRTSLEQLLTVPHGSRRSLLDKLRTGPTVISAPALVRAITRLIDIRDLGIQVPVAAKIPPSRLAALARFANTSKNTAIAKLPRARKLATLVAFVYTVEATAMDDALQVLEILLRNLFADAAKADQKARLRTLKDLDAAAIVLVNACTFLFDVKLPERKVREAIFEAIRKERLADAMQEVSGLVRPPDDVFYRALHEKYRHVRWFLPTVLKHIAFQPGPAGTAVTEALNYLHILEVDLKRKIDAPTAIITDAWRPYVTPEDGKIDKRAYMFCTLDRLRTAISRRDVFVQPSWRYADPRQGLLTADEWESARPIICRTLGLSTDGKAILDNLREELDQTFRRVAARWPDNPAVRIESKGNKHELILTQFDKIEEPPSLKALRKEVAARMPVVDLPEIVLEIAGRTGFTKAFTHVSERASRAEDLMTSLCAVLIAEACNIGFRPLVRDDVPALTRDRLAWVNQNYLRNETLSVANAHLVSAQNKACASSSRCAPCMPGPIRSITALAAAPPGTTCCRTSSPA